MTVTTQLKPIEKRQFHRVDLVCEVRLVIDDEEYWGTVIDMSLNGILITQSEAQKVSLGTHAIAHIKPADDSSQQIMMHVEIARKHNDHLGCECISIDFMSAKRLRLLMERNNANSQLLKREFAKLADHYL